MNIPIITVTNQPERAKTLVDSANKYNWITHLLHVEWRGFGTKLIATYNYLKEHPEIERFVFADAHDVVVLGTPEEFEEKLPERCNMLISAEKGLWPTTLEPKRELYFNFKHGFNFANSGLYYSTRETFGLFMQSMSPKFEDDDQFLINNFFIHTVKPMILLDSGQTIFNSHSFIADGEYTYENGRVQIMGNQPIFIHKNGGTIDEKLNQMLEGMGI